MKVLRAFSVWLIIIAVETLHGILRRLFLVPVLGLHTSDQIGVLIGSILILLVVGLFYPWLDAASSRAQLLIGSMWCVLTFAFEVALGAVLGLEWNEILAGYNPTQGGLMIFGMILLLFSLRIVSAFRT